MKELDKDLNKFEDELKTNMTGIDVNQAIVETIQPPTNKKKDKLLQKEEKKYGKNITKYRNDKMMKSNIEKGSNVATDIIFDPSEPLYCYCNRPSFGDM